VVIEKASIHAPDVFQPSPFDYTVQPKDTLYGIASKHGLSVTELKALNELSSDIIHPGQTLKVQKE
jgi:LysM repeat protein